MNKTNNDATLKLQQRKQQLTNMKNINNMINNLIGTTTKIGPIAIKTSCFGNEKRMCVRITDPNTGKKLMNISLKGVTNF